MPHDLLTSFQADMPDGLPLQSTLASLKLHPRFLSPPRVSSLHTSKTIIVHAKSLARSAAGSMPYAVPPSSMSRVVGDELQQYQAQRLAASSVEVDQLKDRYSVAKTSWHDAEAAQQIARQEAEAVNRALRELDSAPASEPPSRAVAEEEQRLRDKLSALEAVRRDAVARETHQEMLRIEAARTALAVQEAEKEAQIKKAQLETLEAQHEVAAQKRVVAETETRMQDVLQHSPQALHAVTAASAAVRSGAAMANSAAASGALMAGYASGSAAETNELMSMMELHKQLEAAQSKLRTQTRLNFSLQDKLRRQEEKLREAQATENKTRADNMRHTTRQKHESESKMRLEKRLEKRAETAERRCVQLEAMNESLREQLSSARTSQTNAERRAAIAEDNLGPVSKGELRRAQYELAEEKRQRKEAERHHAAVRAAEAKAAAALKAEQAASHDARKVSLHHARRSKDTAMEKLEAERRRTETLEQQLTKAHEDKMRATAEARNRIATIKARDASVPPGGRSTERFSSAQLAYEGEQGLHTMPPPPPPVEVTAMTTSVETAPAARASSPRRPQASPLVEAQHVKAAAMTRVEDELFRAAERAREMQKYPVRHYLNHSETHVHDSAHHHGLFNRTSPGTGAAASSSKSSERAVASLRQRLAESSSRLGELLRSWDTNGSGTIDKVEFRLAVKSLGLGSSEEACDAVFHSFDVNGSGVLDYSELESSLYHGAASNRQPADAWGVHLGASGASHAATATYGWSSAAAGGGATPRSASPTPGVAAARREKALQLHLARMNAEPRGQMG